MIIRLKPPDEDYTIRRRILRWLLRQIVFRFFFKIDVYDMHLVPSSGPTILMMNHIAVMDPVVLVGLLTDRDVVPMSKIENFYSPFTALFVRLWGAFPVRRGEVDRNAIRKALEVLKQDRMLLIAPEGHRAPHLLPAHDGVTYIALKSDAVLVPVAVDGTDEFSGNLLQLRPTRVTIRFGQPFKFRKMERQGRRLPREIMRRMTQEAMYRLAQLLPKHRRGAYSDLSMATTEHLVFVGG